jgi:hypothetical protein
MPKLTAKKRNALPEKSFAEPGKRKYPIENSNHAKNALARVSQFGTEAEKKEVRAKVHALYPNIGKKTVANKKGKSQKKG